MISIIIPTWNGEKTLSDCFASILNQNYRDFEVIAVNDGSTDNSLEIIKRFEKVFKKAGIGFEVCNQENKGAPVARNVGFKKSKGEYLLFCDSDIVLRPDALNIFLNELNKSKASYAYSSHKFGGKLFKFWPFDIQKLKQMPYVHSTSLIRRSDFPKNGWDESLKRLQDWDLFLTMLENGHTGVWIDKVLFEIKTGGTMSNWLPSFMYRFLPFLPSVKNYTKAVNLIKNKHKLK